MRRTPQGMVLERRNPETWRNLLKGLGRVPWRRLISPSLPQPFPFVALPKGSKVGFVGEFEGLHAVL